MAKSVKCFEQGNGLDTALYKKHTFTFFLSSNLKLVLGLSGHKTYKNPHFEYLCEVKATELFTIYID